MKMRLDCLPCLFRQTLESARMVTDDQEMIKDIIKKYSKMLPEIIDSDQTAPETTAKMQSYIKKKSGITDPYAELKKKNLEAAHKLLPLVEEEIAAAEDSLLAAFLMSAMGNSIDAGVSLNVNIKENIESALENSFARSDYQQFLEELKNAEELLFIADNTGEAVFDKLLLQKLKKDYDLKITYAVRETAVLNDITYQGAVELGIDQYAEIIKSGSRAPGMIMDAASQEFLKHYKKADLVISKGQGNLESLYNIESNIYFLLKAKCDVIAEVLNVEEGDFVLMYS
ncbi:MAG: damage-control phosphatase ARMT1 family protein [Bacillota bacterium]